MQETKHKIEDKAMIKTLIRGKMKEILKHSNTGLK